MDTFWQDLRYGFRMLLRKPSFTAVAALALALGIGANTAIFSVVNAVLLEPLPYRDADRLVMVWGNNLPKGATIDLVSPGDLAEWKAQNHVFEDLAGSRDASYSLTGMGEPESIFGYRFAANFFHVLGVNALLGRTFLPEEDRPGSDKVVVLSHRLWQRRFGGDPGVIGKSITLSGAPYTVIGIMPPGFSHPRGAELWTPLALDPSLMNNRQRRFLRVAARLKPGVTREQAQKEMDGIAARIAAQYPETNAGEGVNVVKLEYIGDARTPLLVLLGAVGFVLLIACANVANLLLVRAAARQKEIAIRTALGASRLRLVRQFLTESVLLSLFGGALGLLLAFWSVGPMRALFQSNIENFNLPKVEAIPVDGRALGFSLLLSLLTGVIFGLLPALQASKPDLNLTLKESGGSSTVSARGRRFRDLLVVAEIALALMLLIGAGLMIKSFLRLQQGDLGLNPKNVLTMQVMLPQYKYPDAQKRLAFLQGVLQRVETLPGVQSVGAINFLPLSGFWGTASFSIEGRPLPKPGEEPGADNRVITPHYLRAMGIRLVRGRDFTERDREGAPQVAIINETLARRYWPSEDPIGKRLNLGEANNPSWWEIVGVAGDVKAFGLEQETHADLYRPFLQVPFPLIAFTIRTAADPMRLAAAVRQEIWTVDKDQPVFKVLTMEQLASDSVTFRRVSMLLLGFFAAVALVLAATGIYGVMAYAVTQRTHEIGIRLALGARTQDVVSMILRQGMLLALIGVAIGLAASLALTRVMSSLLYGVSATDPLTFIGISALLVGIALLACYLPARRATQVDPMVALRYE